MRRRGGKRETGNVGNKVQTGLWLVDLGVGDHGGNFFWG
jgi:hypothetical protein